MRIFVMSLRGDDSSHLKDKIFDEVTVLLRKQIEIKECNNIEVYHIIGNTKKEFSGDLSPENIFKTDMEWKNSQTDIMIDNFKHNRISSGDKILFLDAWHPGIIQLKMLSDNMKIPVEVHSMWHSGSYDICTPFAKSIKDKRWAINLERSFYYASDYNYFSTTYHLNLFREAVLGFDNEFKYYRVGFPLSKLESNLKEYKNSKKKRQIFFPHGELTEEQIRMMRDLETSLLDSNIEVKWIPRNFVASDFFNVELALSTICLSISDYGTFDIDTCVKAPLVNCVPLMPIRLSYVELSAGYNQFTYSSDCTKNWYNYQKHKHELTSKIHWIFDNYESLLPVIENYCEYKLPIYTNCAIIIENILKQGL